LNSKQAAKTGIGKNDRSELLNRAIIVRLGKTGLGASNKIY
jgi:hypothetical protein